MCSQDFAEKPQGDALRAMQVDTTKLGLDAERWASQYCRPHLVLACTAARLTHMLACAAGCCIEY